MKTPDSFTSFSVDSPHKIRRIRNVLRDAGYTERSVQKLLDCDELPMSLQRSQTILLYVWRVRGRSPVEILVRLFLLRQAVSLDEVRRCIKSTQLADWVEVGLLHVNGCGVTATVELCPYRSFIVAADWPEDARPDLHQVMGIAASSRTLAQATIRRHSKETLDLGAGGGILALLAAAHSEHVVAVDCNPRALRMAKLNAQLNGLTNIEFLEGNLFDAVGGRQFDLILCNPPFVIAPEQIYLHSHSGVPLDCLCESIVRAAPAFMREGGYCQLLCNWVQLAGEDWRARLESWLDGSGCDAWILHSHSEEIADYAFNRLSNLAPNAEQLEKQFHAWMAYYERERVEAIGFGLITMRRSSGATNWFRYESWPKMIGPCGEAIEQGFACRDFLEAHRDDRKLLQTCLRSAPNLRRLQDQEISGAEITGHSSLQLTGGLAYSANADGEVVEFVSRCTGEYQLSDYLNQKAAQTGQDVTQLAPRFLKVVRRLIELGFLLPTSPERKSSIG